MYESRSPWKIPSVIDIRRCSGSLLHSKRPAQSFGAKSSANWRRSKKRLVRGWEVMSPESCYPREKVLVFLAAGNLIMERTIQACCEDTQIRYVSFVTSPNWAHVWKPLSELVWEYQVFNTSSYGRALHSLVRGKRFIEDRASVAKARMRRAKDPEQSGD
jgi:hypothetical protein